MPSRIVVVDDSADIREILAELLRRDGYEVETADDGPAAIEVIRRFKPDVAFIDIGLPTMSGYEVARTVRSEMRDHETRLIAITGHTGEHVRIQAHAAGFDLCITKPASRTTLLGALHSKPDLQR